MLDIGISADSEVLIPTELGVQVQGLTAPLEHLYHDTPLSAQAPFLHVVGIPSPDLLDLLGVHMSAHRQFGPEIVCTNSIKCRPSCTRCFRHPWESKNFGINERWCDHDNVHFLGAW
ncbi:hypothetical protein BDR07DRAFT_1447086 [Suillus spraguei]|nr:hypothetical protein BDR07DRAFT_1447085 [Suillus spraguei]KAG2351026.1 hypothetical protein BDR07DRAFT_1447086 [Suillus spraguei]